MRSSTLSEIVFDQAIGLQDGEEIRIPCKTPGEAESLRIQLYKQRKIFAERMDKAVAEGIGITRKGTEILVYKKSFVSAIKYKDGEAVGFITSLPEGETDATGSDKDVATQSVQ